MKRPFISPVLLAAALSMSVPAIAQIPGLPQAQIGESTNRKTSVVQSSSTEALANFQMPGELIHRQRQARFLVQVSFLPANHAQDVDRAMRGGAVTFYGTETGSYSGESETTATPLLSVGMLAPLSSNVDVGWAVGWVQSVKTTARIHHQQDSPDKFSDAVGQFETRYLRVTTNIQLHRVLTRFMSFRFSAGLGGCHISGTGHTQRIDGQDGPGTSGNFGPYTQDDFGTADTFTYDLAPSIAFVTRRYAIDVALVYVQFGKVKPATVLPGIDWHPLGLRVGVEF